MAKTMTDPAKDIKALIQATKDCIGDSDQDSNDGSTCASCGQELEQPENEDEDCDPFCKNKNCRAPVLRRLCTRLAKKYGFKEPGMSDKKYDLPDS